MSNLSQDPNLCYWCRLVGLTPSPVPSYLGHMANTMIPQWTVHDRCRKARESAELDQAELAERMEVSRATVSNYETGFVTYLRPIVLRAWARHAAPAAAPRNAELRMSYGG